MKDWKGNEIEVGQTVLTINVRRITEGSKMMIMFRGANDEWHKHDLGLRPEPRQYLWEIQQSAIIMEQSPHMTISFGDAPSQIPIDQMDMFCHAQPWQIIAIKGISDNEQEYYEWEFSNH